MQPLFPLPRQTPPIADPAEVSHLQWEGEARSVISSTFRFSMMFSYRTLVSIIIALTTMLVLTTPVAAASAPVSDAHIAVHFDLASGQQPENITLEPDGSADLTFGLNRQIARVTLGGQIHVLATVPAPPAGASTPLLKSPFLGGIVRTSDGTLYFNYSTGTSELTGIWRLRPGGTPERIAALPATSLANGLALDEQTGLLYVADSALGTVWRVSLHGGTPTAWASGAALMPTSFAGANGIKVHHGAVWVTNIDRGTLLRIPPGPDGRAGTIETRATGLTMIDDFAFIGDGDTLLAALNGPSQLALVKADGTHTIVLTAADGLSNPTSVAVRGTTIYVPSAAYVTQKDPNLLLAQLSCSW